MLEVVLSGLVTGWAIAIPIGAVGAFLVTLTARTSWRVGAAAALGIATVDGLYAALAVAGGATLAGMLAPVAGPLRILSALVLLGIALLTARHALSSRGREPRAAAIRPGRAYLLFLGLTAANPATVVYFAAIVLGNPHLAATLVEAAAFVSAAVVASASWQLGLVGGGVALGRVIVGPRGRLVTGLVSTAVIALLAVRTVWS